MIDKVNMFAMCVDAIQRHRTEHDGAVPKLLQLNMWCYCRLIDTLPPEYMVPFVQSDTLMGVKIDHTYRPNHAPAVYVDINNVIQEV